MPDTPQAVVERSPPRAWLGLAVIALPCMLYAMDLTVLNLALPTLAAALRPSATQLLWIVDIYGFMVAGLLITMGAIGDRIGRRRLLLAGAAAFGAASVLAAFSTSAAMLIAARALLGVAGATLAPSTLSLIRHLFEDPRERTLAIGLWVASYSVGAAIGPVAGGLLLEAWGWGAVFLVAVPVMALLLVLGPFLLPEYRPPRAAPLDVPGVVLSIASVVATIHGIKQIASFGFSLASIGSLAAGLAIGWIFVRRQASHPAPLVDLSLFRAPAFSAALGAYGLACFVAFGTFVFVAQYLQLVLGLAPLHAAFWGTPISLAFVTGSIGVPLLARRFAPVRLVAVGFGLAAAGFAGLACVQPAQSPAWAIAAAVVFSLGLTPVFTLATDLVVGSAPPHRTGAASAILETVAEFGGALGIALLGSLGAAGYRIALARAWPAGAAPEAATRSITESLAWASTLEPAARGTLIAASREAFTDALRLGAVVCAGLCLLAALMAIRGLARARAH